MLNSAADPDPAALPFPPAAQTSQPALAFLGSRYPGPFPPFPSPRTPLPSFPLSTGVDRWLVPFMEPLLWGRE